MAAELGFEPRHTESESAVLPLHNSAMRTIYYIPKSSNVKNFFDFIQKKRAVIAALLYIILDFFAQVNTMLKSFSIMFI